MVGSKEGVHQFCYSPVADLIHSCGFNAVLNFSCEKFYVNPGRSVSYRNAGHGIVNALVVDAEPFSGQQRGKSNPTVGQNAE
jgi:hypothetical protein